MGRPHRKHFRIPRAANFGAPIKRATVPRQTEGVSDLRGQALARMNKGLETISGLSKMGSLFLRDTRISNDGVVHLKKLVHLNTLYLDRTQITDAGLVHLNRHFLGRYPTRRFAAVSG